MPFPFASEICDAGQTILLFRRVPINATDEERQTFRNAYASMQQGFGGTLDQLGEFLAQQPRSGPQ